MTTVTQLNTIRKNTAAKVEAELSRTGGLLRLAPAWVPRSFLQPGLRIKLHPDDTYAYGLSRGGIDERWFASTTECANEGRVPDEGLAPRRASARPASTPTCASCWRPRPAWRRPATSSRSSATRSRWCWPRS
jgi:hypothetical protein